MPHAKLDGIWCCLCPSFRQSLLGPSRHLLQSLIKGNQYRSHTRYAQDHTPADAPTRLRRDLELRNDSFKRPLRHRGKVYEWNRKPEEPSQLAQLSTEAVYGQLRLAAQRGDYGCVKNYITLLVAIRGERLTSQLYHAMILANVDPQHGSPYEAASLLQEMKNEGIHPHSAIYHAVIKVLSIHPDYVMRQKILHELHEGWFTLTEDGWHDVIVGLIRDRQLELAMDKIEHIERQGIQVRPWLYDILVYNLCELSEFDEALKIMQRRFFSDGAPISQSLWYHFLDSASRSLHYDSVAFIWRYRAQFGYYKILPSGICINVLNTAARKGDTQLATTIFLTLRNRKQSFDMHHYEALLESWLAADNLKAAFAVLSVMLQSRLPPTEVSTRAIFHYLCNDYNRPTEALQILRQLKDEGRPIPHAAFNVVLEAFIRFNDLGSALESYKTMHLIIPSGPDTSTFNELLRGCRFTRRYDLAMFFASEMLALKIPPDAKTYDRLILASLGARGEADGGFENAWRYFEEMRQMDWWPRVGTVKLLGKAGCEIADERVSELVHQRGFDEGRMGYLRYKFWGRKLEGGGRDKDGINEENAEEATEIYEEY